jgi:hypothetical protein
VLSQGSEEPKAQGSYGMNVPLAARASEPELVTGTGSVGFTGVWALKAWTILECRESLWGAFVWLPRCLEGTLEAVCIKVLSPRAGVWLSDRAIACVQDPRFSPQHWKKN